jgi:hypothetical protein
MALRTPHELWLRIACYLDSNDLCNLAVTNKKLKPIAQERLIKQGIVPVRSIPRYINELPDENDGNRKDWAKNIKTLELRQCAQVPQQWQHEHGMLASFGPSSLTNIHDENSYQNVLGRYLLDFELLHDWQQYEFARSDSISVCMVVLLSLLPNLEELRFGTALISTQFFRYLLEEGPGRCLLPLGGYGIIEKLWHNLKTLDIRTTYRKNEIPYFGAMIDVRQFTQLESFNLPHECMDRIYEYSHDSTSAFNYQYEGHAYHISGPHNEGFPLVCYYCHDYHPKRIMAPDLTNLSIFIHPTGLIPFCWLHLLFFHLSEGYLESLLTVKLFIRCREPDTDENYHFHGRFPVSVVEEDDILRVGLEIYYLRPGRHPHSSDPHDYEFAFEMAWAKEPGYDFSSHRSVPAGQRGMMAWIRRDRMSGPSTHSVEMYH